MNPSLLNHASTLKDITDVLIELILWTAIPEKDVQNIDTGNYIKKENVLGTIDLSKLPTTYFLTTYTSDGRSTSAYLFRGNSEFYLGNHQDALGALGWCIIAQLRRVFWWLILSLSLIKIGGKIKFNKKLIEKEIDNKKKKVLILMKEEDKLNNQLSNLKKTKFR